jgi:phosphoribosylformylglycinamidine cyclo-ligase
VDASVDSSLQYSGQFYLNENLNEVLGNSLGLASHSTRDGLDFGRWLLSPTRTYAPLIGSLLEDIGPEGLHGMIHCSGGGQTKVLHFVKNLKVIKDDCFEIPPLFALIQKITGTSWQEMYRVFNMGHRLELYIPESLVTPVLEWGKHYGIAAKVVGRVVEATSDSPALQINGPEGILCY